MVRHLTKLIAGLIADNAKQYSMGPVQLFPGERHKCIRSKEKPGREDTVWRDHPGYYEVH